MFAQKAQSLEIKFPAKCRDLWKFIWMYIYDTLFRYISQSSLWFNLWPGPVWLGWILLQDTVDVRPSSSTKNVIFLISANVPQLKTPEKNRCKRFVSFKTPFTYHSEKRAKSSSITNRRIHLSWARFSVKRRFNVMPSLRFFDFQFSLGMKKKKRRKLWTNFINVIPSWLELSARLKEMEEIPGRVRFFLISFAIKINIVLAVSATIYMRLISEG